MGIFNKKFHANLKINVVVKDHSGKVIFTKSYAEKGPEEYVSRADSVNVQRAGFTTTAAFKILFNKLASDVKSLRI